MQGKLQGEGKKIRVWRTGDTEYTETKFYHVEREGEVDLKNLAENALQKANVQLVKGVLPYQFNEMKDFNMGYLSGFMAEKRDIEQKAVEGNMQATMKNSAEKLMRESVQDTMRYRSTHSGWSRRRRTGLTHCFRSGLLPIRGKMEKSTIIP